MISALQPSWSLWLDLPYYFARLEEVLHIARYFVSCTLYPLNPTAVSPYSGLCDSYNIDTFILYIPPSSVLMSFPNPHVVHYCSTTSMVPASLFSFVKLRCNLEAPRRCGFRAARFRAPSHNPVARYEGHLGRKL